MTKAAKTREAKRQAFGTGKQVYRKENDYPFELDDGGMHWYRTNQENHTVKTGMQNFLYITYDTDRDIRLFVDAAGNIWNEDKLGIL